ncbi:MAG TPA: glycosyltransferase family 2 protein [Bryobacteraceae bacterium]|nr:glycosyltransferase family 2 protein [Bryobacteraceae bacterium]
MTPSADSRSLLIIVPAFNEQASIAAVIRETQEALPGVRLLVIDDCSTDATASLAREAGVEVLSLPHHLGLGGAVQAGYKLAYELGYRFVIRIDGDGQHDPRDVPLLFQTLRDSGCQMVIGSRFLEEDSRHTSLMRKLGVRFFRAVLRPILGKAVRDPTSGFVGVNQEALQVFSRSFPLEYPEIEALVVLQRRAFRFVEVPVKMRRRMGGRSSITTVKSVYYIVHVLLGVLVNILKFERRRWRR